MHSGMRVSVDGVLARGRHEEEEEEEDDDDNSDAEAHFRIGMRVDVWWKYYKRYYSGYVDKRYPNRSRLRTTI